MSSTERISPAVIPNALSDVAATPRPRLRAARHVLAAGAAIGVLAQLLFFGMRAGLNVPLTVGAVLLAAWSLRRPGARLDPLDAWLPIGALALAAFCALRADLQLLGANLMGMTALSVGAVAALSGVPVTRRSLGSIVSLAGHLVASLIAGAVPAAIDASARWPSASRIPRRASSVTPVVRGLLLAAPLVFIFLVLFASADAVFARALLDTFSFRLDIGDLPGRALLAAVVAYPAIGLLAWVAWPTFTREETRPDTARRPLGAVEAATMVVVLDLLFALFVAYQAAYLFGGLDTMAAAGLTYAEYARRGFFELCAVAAIVGCLILGLEALTRRSRAYVIGAAGLVILTGFVLASAALRMGLYQQAYGWTEQRFWTAAAIAWMSGGLIAMAVALLTDRSRWLPHALIVWGLVIGLAVNVIGPERFVAEQNLARAIDTSLVSEGGHSGLDAAYLRTLDLDAVEPLVAALPHLDAPERTDIRRVLGVWRLSDEVTAADAWQEWNLSRARARELLRGMFGE